MPQLILIAEDDRAFANLLVRAIEGAGYACATAADGLKALQSIDAQRPDLILLDLLLPKKDGRAVLALLQQNEGTADIPVVAMSGIFRGRATARELQDAGAQGFLEKPFKTRDMIAHLHTLVGPPRMDTPRVESPDVISLAERPLAEVLWEAMSDGFNGALQLKRGKLKKVIVFEGGIPKHVRSNAAQECLGRRLLRAGRIDKAALDESLERTKADGVRQGEVLVEMGLVAPEEIQMELAAQAADKLLEPFTWHEGEAWLQPDVTQISYASSLEGWTPRSVLYRGVARMKPERAGERLLVHTGSEVAVEEPGPDEYEQQLPGIAPLLDALTPGVTVGELLESHVRALYALSVAGDVRLIDKDGGPTVVEAVPCESSEDELPEDARELNATLEQMREQSYFEMFGVGDDVSVPDLRTAFLEFAKVYHPDRFSDRSQTARGLAADIFSLASTANESLSDGKRRRAYVERMKSGRTEEEDRAAMRSILAAEQKFNEAEALFKRRSYSRANEMFAEILRQHPDEADFHAYFGWSHFLAENGADTAARLAKEHLGKAIELAPKSPTGYYFLGRLHKACNEDASAKRMFRMVLELRPSHVEASRELRLMQMRSGKDPGSSGRGLFGLGRKKK